MRSNRSVILGGPGVALQLQGDGLRRRLDDLVAPGLPEGLLALGLSGTPDAVQLHVDPGVDLGAGGVEDGAGNGHAGRDDGPEGLAGRLVGREGPVAIQHGHDADSAGSDDGGDGHSLDEGDAGLAANEKIGTAGLGICGNTGYVVVWHGYISSFVFGSHATAAARWRAAAS